MCIRLSLQGNGSVKCILPFDAMQRLNKHVLAATNKRNVRRSVGRIICSVVHILPKEVRLCVPLLLLGNSSVNTLLREGRIVGGVVLYAARVFSKARLWVCLCIPVSLLGNNSINTLPRERRIVGGIVFYAVRVLSEESLVSLCLSPYSCWVTTG
jgi:hypothetical protein